MIRKLIYIFSITALTTTLLINRFPIFKESDSEEEKEQEEAEMKIPLKDRIDLAWAQEREMTLDPATGDVPRQRLLEAWEYTKTLIGKNQMGKAAITGVSWTERGPNNCGGRTRTMHIDKNDVTNKTIWTAGVAGGLWKTTDITQTNPTWTIVNDFLGNLAITSITQSISNTNIMYFCTGEGYGNSDATRGLGVWKSVDGGATWSQLSSTNNSSFYYCHKIYCPSGPDTVFVCTTTGLYRSVNAGTSFTKVLGSGISSAGGNIVYDIERASNGTLYASTSSSSSATGTIHKSYNNGATWTNPLTLPTSFSKKRMELAVCENDTNSVWAVVENSSTIVKIMKSTDAGVSWAATTGYPDDADSGIPATDFSRGQAWYDISIAVDPNNPNVCFVGGVDLFKTSNGGTSWQQISHWYGGFGYQDVHADQHFAMFEPGSSAICYFSNDGGIYRTTNATATTPTLSSKEIGYRTTQFYACAVHPTSTDFFLAGAQDNGSHRFTASGINSTSEVTGGDGVYCHIDQDQSQYMWTSYVYSNYYRSTNGGSSFSSALSNSTGRFVNPSDYDNTNNIMYMATSSGAYLRWSNPQSGNSVSTVTVSGFSGQVSAVTVSPNTSNRVFFGCGGKIYRVDNAHSGTSLTGTDIGSSSFPSGAYLNCIEVEKGNDNHILVVFTNYGVNSIWETWSGGSTWTSVEGNLPDMPIRWAIFHPQNAYKALVATELGVWSTDSLRGTTTNWGATNSGFANVRVDMLQIRESDRLLAAATHGRGLYTCYLPASAPPNVVNADFTASKKITYPDKTIQFTSTSTGATSYFWTFGDGTTSTSANPSKTYTQDGIYTVSLNINNGGSVMTKTGFIRILPYRGTPYTLAMGGNFDTNPFDFISDSSTVGTYFQRGSSSISGKSGTNSGFYAWVLGLTQTNYLDNSVAYLYTPSYNMSSTGSYTLQFLTKYNFEASYDGMRVEYSLDGGDSWSVLGTSVATNWYDFANTTTTSVFPNGQAFFNTGSGTYSVKTYSLNSLAGNNKVAFRFVFKSDVNTTAVGAAIDDWQITGPTNAPFPVSFLYFKARRSSATEVNLSWATSSEQNNAGFEIQRRDENAAAFERVAFVEGGLNSNTLLKYIYTDRNDNTGVSYYRLKQTDLDGTFDYSEILRVAANEIDSKLVSSLIPDASGKRFTVVHSAKGEVRYSVINSSGQWLRHNAVLHNSELAFDGLKPGIYFIEFRSGNDTQVEKVFIP